ncbi:MAG: ATP-grasp domain-containing protein [Rhodospirillales bacterium]
MTRIGFVYDSRDEYLAAGFTALQVAEFDTEDTLVEIESALQRLGNQVERIGNGRKLAARLAEGARWDLIFSVAEGLKGRSREAQVPAVCELFDQPYAFSDPLTMAVTLDKAVAKQLVRDSGIPTAPFVVMERGKDSIRHWSHYPAFVKPLAEGTGKGCEHASLVENEKDLRAAAAGLIQRFNQPALVEAFLPGREFTVGIVGNGADARCIGIMEICVNKDSEAGVYSFNNKEFCETLVSYHRASDDEALKAGDTALAAYRALGCRDASRVDIKSDVNNVPTFLEVNPLAGLHPSHSDLPMLAEQNGISYDQLLLMILDAARERLGLGQEIPGRIKASA